MNEVCECPHCIAEQIIQMAVTCIDIERDLLCAEDVLNNETDLTLKKEHECNIELLTRSSNSQYAKLYNFIGCDELAECFINVAEIGGPHVLYDFILPEFQHS